MPISRTSSPISLQKPVLPSLNVTLRHSMLFSTRLAEYPDIGAPRPRLGPYTRIGIISPYIAIYDHKDDLVTVLQVLHGHRKITAKLLRP